MTARKEETEAKAAAWRAKSMAESGHDEGRKARARREGPALPVPIATRRRRPSEGGTAQWTGRMQRT